MHWYFDQCTIVFYSNLIHYKCIIYPRGRMCHGTMAQWPVRVWVTSLRSCTNCTGWEHQTGFSSSLLFVCTSVCTGQHRRISPMSSSIWLISRPGDTFDLLPHCHWMSVIHGCPPSVIGLSLSLLPALGTVLPQRVTSAPSMPVFWSRLKPGYSLQTFIHMTYRNFCSACAVTKLSFSDTLIVFFTFYLLYFV